MSVGAQGILCRKQCYSEIRQKMYNLPEKLKRNSSISFSLNFFLSFFFDVACLMSPFQFQRLDEP